MVAVTRICSSPSTVGLQSWLSETIYEEHSQVLQLQPLLRKFQGDRNCLVIFYYFNFCCCLRVVVLFFFFPSPRSCYKQLWKLRLVIFTSYSRNLRVSLSHSSQECRLASSDHLETTGFFPGSISTDGNMFITLTVVPNTITVCLTLKQSREYYIAR